MPDSLNKSSNQALTIPPYPWQDTTWQALMSDLKGDRLAHALLLHGPAGLGKGDFALCLAQALLCTVRSQAIPCGTCKSCQLFQSHNHPDFVVIEPLEPGKSIRIDQVRGISDLLVQTAQQGGRRCIVIRPADALNLNAANALLKSLEEPPTGTTFILTATSLQQLGATIRSRCRFVPFTQPSKKYSLTWLMARGLGKEQAEQLLTSCSEMPLAALAASEGELFQQQNHISKQLQGLIEGRESLVDVAKDWSALDTFFVINTLLTCLNSGIKQSRADTGADPEHWSAGGAADLVNVISEIESTAVFLLYDKVLAAKKLFLSSANPNKNLLWEDILLDWLKCAHQRPATSRQA